MIGGESKNPVLADEKISKYIKNKKEITKVEFERAKKVIWGDFVRTFNNVEKVAGLFIRYILKGINVFEFKEIFDSVDIDFVNDKFKTLFVDDKKSISIVYPNKEN